MTTHTTSRIRSACLSRTLLAALAVVAPCAASLPSRAQDPPPAHELAAPPPFDHFLVVPLRIHVLSSDRVPEADCKLTDDDLARILRKMNRVWNQAGIHFAIEAILHEQAEGEERFLMARDNAVGEPPLQAFALLRPEATRERGRLHVYYIHELPVNGVYLNDGTALVKDTARLRDVPGGIDEPIPRVTSHELGHALGLPHRQNRTNLMASGTTGTSLNTDEIARARERAVARWSGIRSSDLLRQGQAALESDDLDTAKRISKQLMEIPNVVAGSDHHAVGRNEDLQLQIQIIARETRNKPREPTDAHPRPHP